MIGIDPGYHIHLFISSDDGQDELDTARQLESVIKGIDLEWFTDRGHFTMGGMKTEKFPELLQWLLP